MEWSPTGAWTIVPIDLGEQLVDETLGRDLLERLATRVDHPHVLRAGDAEVGVASLADAVDGTAEHGHLDWVLVGLKAPLDLGDDGVHVELESAARGARDQDRTALAQLQRLEISQATLTSSSAWKVESEIRIVSPMPSASNVPRPTADFREPDHLVPASVTPRWSGYGIRSARSRFEAIGSAPKSTSSTP